jgi:hypothetical protein
MQKDKFENGRNEISEMTGTACSTKKISLT